MDTKVLLLLALVALVKADDPYHNSESYESSEAKYDFSYSVKDDSSSNEFGHEESRDGDYTQGSYYVKLPDGRLQKVTYYVEGDSGYVADVSYEGEAHYDSHESGSEEYYRPRYS